MTARGQAHPTDRDAGPIRFDVPLDPALLQSMLGGDFAVEVAAPALALELLYPEERRQISRAVEKRQAEFSTARACARRALARLGTAPSPLLSRADRSPRWPRGVAGSISHTADCCVVAVTNVATVLSVGLDVEQELALPPALEPSVCTEQERRWLKLMPDGDRAWLRTLVFSAKESFYKCQHPITQQWLEFADIDIDIDLEHASFGIRSAGSELADGLDLKRVEGRFRRSAGFVVTSAVLRSPSGSRRST